MSRTSLTMSSRVQPANASRSPVQINHLGVIIGVNFEQKCEHNCLELRGILFPFALRGTACLWNCKAVEIKRPIPVLKIHFYSQNSSKSLDEGEFPRRIRAHQKMFLYSRCTSHQSNCVQCTVINIKVLE